MQKDWIDSYFSSLGRSRKSRRNLITMRKLMNALDHPEKAFPTVHVAGTNGKGSTCSMLDSIYRNAGYKTGLFTSPHLINWEERIRVNGNPIPSKELIKKCKQFESAKSNLKPIFFEAITAIALDYFREQNIDIAFLEVGLGGRTDATNIVQPILTIITSIGLDHTEILGDTCEKIALEKAGILKPGIPLVLGKVSSSVKKVIEEKAKEKKVKVFYTTEHFTNDWPESSLVGEQQKLNAGTAKLACEVLQKRFPISKQNVENGLKSTNLLGRWQSVNFNGKLWILDNVHNQSSWPYTEANIKNTVNLRNGQKPHVVCAFSNLQRANELLPKLIKIAESITISQIKNFTTGQNLEELIEICQKHNFFKFNTVNHVEDAMKKRLEEKNSWGLIVGSSYLVGDALKFLLESKY